MLTTFMLAVAVMLILFGAAATLIGLFRYFFPGVDAYIPAQFQRVLSISCSAYPLLIGLLLLLLLGR